MKTKELATCIEKASFNAKERVLSDREVAPLFGIGKSIVPLIYKCFREQNTVEFPRNGAPRKSTERDDQIVARIVKLVPKKTAADATKYANDRLKFGITTCTARNMLT